MTAPILIIGSMEDLHVQAVHSQIRTNKVLVVDVAHLAKIEYAIGVKDIRLGFDGCTYDLTNGWRGWIRRLSPPDWEEGVVIGSHDAASMAAWLSLLAALLRNPGSSWLTGLDAMTAAENKMTQYAVASRLGLSVPPAIVTNIRSEAAGVASDLIAKPLGPGHFRSDEGEWRTVFTEAFNPSSSDGDLLIGPPFVVQERVTALSHKRIVTVDDRAWVFSLDGDGLPIDWRQEARAHREWRQDKNEPLCEQAVLLANSLSVGYSSQDWIETTEGFQFIDLNPAGQWLFLPDPGAAEISSAIAEWVSEE